MRRRRSVFLSRRCVNKVDSAIPKFTARCRKPGLDKGTQRESMDFPLSHAYNKSTLMGRVGWAASDGPYLFEASRRHMDASQICSSTRLAEADQGGEHLAGIPRPPTPCQRVASLQTMCEETWAFALQRCSQPASPGRAKTCQTQKSTMSMPFRV